VPVAPPRQLPATYCAAAASAGNIRALRQRSDAVRVARFIFNIPIFYGSKLSTENAFIIKFLASARRRQLLKTDAKFRGRGASRASAARSCGWFL
jgi:hypothetical protein